MDIQAMIITLGYQEFAHNGVSCFLSLEHFFSFVVLRHLKKYIGSILVK